MLLNTGRELVQSRHGLLSTLAFRVGPCASGYHTVHAACLLLLALHAVLL